MHRKEAAVLPLPAEATRKGASKQTGCRATGFILCLPPLRLLRRLSREETDGGGAAGRRAQRRLRHGDDGRGAEHGDGARLDVPQEVRPLPYGPDPVMSVM